MVKYLNAEIVFEEIPDEVTLAINITNCQNRCEGCHSPELRRDIGEELTNDVLETLIKDNDGITCVCFMGEGKDREALLGLARYLKEKHPNLMRAIYSGRENVENDFISLFDYVKTGPYIPEKGPLNVKTTNQRLIMYNHPRPKDTIVSAWFCMDITYKFWTKRQ